MPLDTSEDPISGRAGGATIVATGATAADAMTELLSGILRLLQPVAPPATGRWVSIRAEAESLPELLSGLTAEVFDRMEAIGQDLAGIDIHGVVRSDRGMVGWGMAELAAGPAPATGHLSINVLHVEESLSGTTIHATLSRGLVNDR